MPEWSADAGRPLRTVLFSTLYPSAARPLHGIFVETRLRELLRTGAVATRVVAPVPWFFSTHPRWGRWAQMAATPRDATRHGVGVAHPRYALLPKLGMTLAPLALALAALPVLRRWQREGFDFDLIDAHYFYPDGVAAALLSQWLGKPVAITARGSDLNLIARYAAPRRMMRWAARRAAACIGVSGALTDVLRGWGVDPGKLHVIGNGVDGSRFTPQSRQTARQALALPLDGPLLLCVGHLVELKGYHLAIEALAMLRQAGLPGARLAIVGDGPERARLQQLAAALGVADAVRLCGAVPNDALFRWYGAADLLLAPSSREGWPNVLLEALACGTPVVASRVGGIPEVLNGAPGCAMIDDRTAAALAAAARQVVVAAPDRHALRGYAELHGWQRTSQLQLELFGRLVKAAEGVAHA